MRKIEISIIIVVLLLVIFMGYVYLKPDNDHSSVLSAQANIRTESVSQVKSRIDNNDKYILVDVRTNEEFLEGHIEKSILVPVDTIQSNIEEKVQDKNTSIIVYCRTGRRSLQAQETLKNLGYKDVTNMEGGIVAWQSANYPVIK